jgi:hypothetical protein
MITVSIWRKTLVRLHACGDGIELFDRIAAMQSLDDPRRLKRPRGLRVERRSLPRRDADHPRRGKEGGAT